MKRAASRAVRPTVGIVLILSFVILLSACQPAATPELKPTTPPTTALVATQPATAGDAESDLPSKITTPLWMLLGYGDALNPTVIETGTTVTVQFAKDGSLNGFGGCNNFFGSYELKDESIQIGPLGSTMMACDKGMNQESLVMNALQLATQVTITPQGRLEISYDPDSTYERKLVFTPSGRSLTDTLWMLEAFGKPDNPSAPEAGTMITAQFSESGLLSGDAGCNRYTTSYMAENGRMEIAMPASTLRACTVGMEQEAAFYQALMKAESYTIQGNTLEITYNGGQGVLRFTSEHLPLENVLWTLATINGEVNRVGLVATTALFEPGTEPGKGTVGGVAMCNNYSGSYTTDEGSLKVEGVATTWSSCPDDVMQIQAAYIELLENAASYQVYGDTLVVTSEMGVLTFSANRVQLEGTYWRLVSMGDIISPTIPSQGDEFTAQFVPQAGGPSGLIIGSTGCNDYNAVYIANLNEIKVNLPNKSNNPACPVSFWEQEQQFFLGLNAATTYRILGNTLEIPYDEGRQALNFTAYVPQVPPPPSGGPLTPLHQTRWWLVMLGSQPVLPGTEVTGEFAINLDGQTGTFSGNAGCNTYNAAITKVFQVGSTSQTKKFCPEPDGLMNQEAQFLAYLQTASAFTLAQNQLIITTRSGPLVFYNSPAPLQPIAPPNLPPVEPEQPPVLAPTDVPIAPPCLEYIPTEQPTEEPPADALLAVIKAPVQCPVGQPAQFDASNSIPAMSITDYAWDFGDGGSASGAMVEHVFAKQGVYTVTLTITDINGKTATVMHIITIQ